MCRLKSEKVRTVAGRPHTAPFFLLAGPAAATSNDPWGPAGTLMQDIADATYNQ